MGSGYNLSGRVGLVTGGASGFGREVARLLTAAGADVLVCDIDEGGGQSTAAEVGGTFLRTDVSSLDDNLAAVARAVELHGGLDFTFLNAGVTTGCGLGEDFDLELYRRAMGANLDGVVFGVHAALPELRKGEGGAIVATSSLAGLTSVPLDPIYAANKHGVVGLTRSLGPGLAAEGVRMNAICPGFADTAIIEPIKGALESEGMPIIPAETVAEVAMSLFTGSESGECWFIQPGRAGAFEFRNLPGPRA